MYITLFRDASNLGHQGHHAIILIDLHSDGGGETNGTRQHVNMRMVAIYKAIEASHRQSKLGILSTKRRKKHKQN